MKEKVNPNHHQGKITGYELINGEYHIAPHYWEQFEELNHKVSGIKAMLDIVTSHASGDLTQISKIRREIFVEIADDIGINLDDGWSYQNGILSPLKKDAEDKK
jgi:ADP-dependent phosphofructokinase/glucokinase